MSTVSPMAMSDEDFIKQYAGATPASSDAEVDSTEEADTNSEEVVEEQEEFAEDTGSEESDSSGSEEQTAETKEGSEGSDDTEVANDDPVANTLEELYKPFKANGKEIQISSVEEARTLMQQGANYNKKMLALKPHLKALRTLDKHKLLENEDTLNFLIDLNNGNPDAIRKLIKDKSIDIMDLDVNESDESGKSYSPVDYHVSDNEMVLDDVLDSIAESPAYHRTLSVITSEWDKASTESLAKNPNQIVLLNKQIEHGIYDKVIKELDRVRALGQYGNLSDFEAYVAVGRAMEAKGLLPEVNASAPAKSKAEPENSKEVERLNKRKAASLTKPTVAKSSKDVDAINPLALSDEEFERMAKKLKY